MFLNVDNVCAIPLEKLPFSLFGLCLQEPMALITNWLIAITAFYLFSRMKVVENAFQYHWKKFYFFFGISTFFGGLGHLLFNYFEVFGKYPCWAFGILSAFHAGKAMISIHILRRSIQRRLTYFLIFKGVVLGISGVLMQSFLFIMIDATITYLFFCMGLGIYYWRKGVPSFKYTVYAVLVLFPSIFIFTLQFNPHLWFNKDDLSHVLIVITIIFFYFGIVKYNESIAKGLKLK